MWDAIKAKIETLADFDKTRQAFGAAHHKYEFGTKLSESDICAWENRSQTRLPVDVRTYYLQFGDGGAGPFYGMKSLSEIDLYKPESPFRNRAYLAALAKSRAISEDEECDYDYEDDTSWFVPRDDYQGLISIIEFGCGEQYCAVTNGAERGAIVFKTMDHGISEVGSLPDAFHRWLDEELGNFRNVVALMEECGSATELNRICSEKFGFYHARDYMVSYLGIEKPASLFGETGHRYHGAVQYPWYDQQFPRKKKKYWFF